MRSPLRGGGFLWGKQGAGVRKEEGGGTSNREAGRLKQPLQALKAQILVKQYIPVKISGFRPEVR